MAINDDTDYTGGLFFKVGRTTGLTCGAINGVPVKMNPLVLNDSEIEYIKPCERHTEEYGITTVCKQDKDFFLHEATSALGFSTEWGAWLV